MGVTTYKVVKLQKALPKASIPGGAPNKNTGPRVSYDHPQNGA